MAGRFPGVLGNYEAEWSKALGRTLTEALRRLSTGMSGLQGTQGDPTEIEAGAVASPGVSQAAASADHTHPVETAAPSLPVALGGASSEGTGTALLRADSQLVLDDGGAVANDGMMWTGAAWAPSDDAEVLNWLGL